MGYAALNIESFTLHSQLGLTIANNSKKAIQNLGNTNISQNKRDKINAWINVISLMIDEISQISAALLVQICMAVCLIKECKKIFGNLNMFFFGDFYQMESISPSLFRTLNECNTSKINNNDAIEITQGRGLWHQLDYAVFLDEPQRAKYKLFSKIKRRIRNGCCEKEDIDILNTLTIQRSSLINTNKFREAPFYTTRHYEIDYINEKRIHFYATEHNKQILKWKTPIFINGKQISSESWIYELLYQERYKFTQKNLKKIGREFIYCEGAPYKILVTPKHGKHTGTVTANIGVMVGIQLNIKEEIHNKYKNFKIRTLIYPPKVLFLHLRKQTLQQKLKGLENFPLGTVPIFPGYETITLDIQKINQNWFNLFSGPAYNVPSEIKIKMFGYKLAPAFANTDYGCQGSTQTHIITNIIPGPNSKKYSSTSAYVILSRATSLDGILLSHPVPEQCLQNNPIIDLIQETCRLKQIERETLKNKKYLIINLIKQVNDIKMRLKNKFSDIDHAPIWVKTIFKYLSNLINNLENLLNIPKKVKTCVSCLEICLSDERIPRCFECIKDNIPPLDLKKCFCGKKYSWTKKDGITRSGNKCDKCSKQYENVQKKQDSSGWKRKRCLSCNNFTFSKLSRFCFKCDPRLSLDSKDKTRLINDGGKRKISGIVKSSIVRNTIKRKENNDIIHSVNNKNKGTKNQKKLRKQTIIKNSFTKLENPGLNLCFLNAAVQFILSIKSLSDLICFEYVRKYCKTSTFLSDFEQFEMFDNPNQPVSPLTVAKKDFLFEFETLAINMIKNPELTLSTTKLAKIFEVLEQGYIYTHQWDCSEIVDTFFTLFEAFIYNENFDGKSDAQEILNSLKIRTKVSTQCNKCNILKILENEDFFFCVPLEKNVDNIFLQYSCVIKDFRCEMCNALSGNPDRRLVTGAVQKTEIISFSKYILIKFGRVKYNHDKVLYNVTLPETNHVLGHHLKLDAWVEHIGQTIKAGHYVLIRRVGDGFVKISDDKISSSNKKCIQNSDLCYIALLRIF